MTIILRFTTVIVASAVPKTHCASTLITTSAQQAPRSVAAHGSECSESLCLPFVRVSFH